MTLGSFFEGLAWKFLKSIDLPNRGSHQHELQGIAKLRELLGDTSHQRFRVTWHSIGPDDERSDVSTVDLTWYDARKNNPNRSAEWRFYYPPGTPLEDAEIGDLLLGARQHLSSNRQGAHEIVFYLVSQHSDLYQKLLWLLGISRDAQPGRLDGTTLQGRPAHYIAQEALLQLDPDLAEHLLASQGTIEELVYRDFSTFIRSPDYYDFPTTDALASFAQNNLDVDAHSDPDTAIERLLELETAAFRILEKLAVGEVLEQQRKRPIDVDAFVSFSLSVQNRRKARRGRSLELHLAHIFRQKRMEFETQVMTEGKSTVDFLFPNKSSYVELSSPILHGVVTLAAKTTLKERWRQVLAEAEKMSRRHLFTLETGISESQTLEMGKSSLSLVVPTSALSSYKNPGTEILSLQDFCDYVQASM